MLAAVQVIGGIYGLIEKLVDARTAAREFPEFLKGSRKHLVNIQKTIQLVGDERRLQTEAVISQVQELRNICQEFHVYLETRTRILGRCTARRYVHALRSRERDEKELKGIVGRLESAKTILDTYILVAHSTMTGIMHEDLVQRIETSGHTGHVDEAGGKSRGVATALAAASSDPPGNSVIYESVSADEGATQFNGDVASDVWQQPIVVEYKGIQAKGQSVQVNGRMDLQAFRTLMATRS